MGGSAGFSRRNAVPDSSRAEASAGLGTACAQLDGRPQYRGGRESTPIRSKLQVAELAWGGRATTPRPRVHRNKGRRAAAPPALPGCHCHDLPQPRGAWNILSTLPGAASTSPQLLPTPSQHKAQRPSVVPNICNELHANLFCHASRGAYHTDRTGGALDLLLSPGKCLLTSSLPSAPA